MKMFFVQIKKKKKKKEKVIFQVKRKEKNYQNIEE